MSQTTTQKEELEVKISRLARDAFAQLNGTYRLLVDDEQRVTVAKIMEPGVLNTVTRDYVTETEMICQYKELTPSKVRYELYPRWQAEMRRQMPAISFDSVLPFAFKSQRLRGEEYAWQRLSFDPTPTACPDTFKQVLERTSAEEARSLVLYVGSLFDYTFPRTQYLYVWGDGNDGKSTLIAALASMFARQGVTTMRSGDFADRHSTTALERTRLLIFADQNNNSFMSTGAFKEMTGDDTLTINPKGQPRRNIRLHCKTVIASNFPPNLSGGRADERRILPVKLRSYTVGEDYGFVARFIGDACAIAQYCLAEFLAWKAEHPGKALPAAEVAMEQVRADSVESVAEGVVKDHFEFGPTLEITAAELARKVKEWSGRDHALGQLIYRVLQRRPGVYRTKIDGVHGWKGVH